MCTRYSHRIHFPRAPLAPSIAALIDLMYALDIWHSVAAWRLFYHIIYIGLQIQILILNTIFIKVEVFTHHGLFISGWCSFTVLYNMNRETLVFSVKVKDFIELGGCSFWRHFCLLYAKHIFFFKMVYPVFNYIYIFHNIVTTFCYSALFAFGPVLTIRISTFEYFISSTVQRGQTCTSALHTGCRLDLVKLQSNM